MASVMQGDAYNIPVTIKSGNGTLITPEIAACVEITVGQFTKRWPGQVTFDEKTGEWQFPVTQKQTFRFAPGAAVVQARVVFQDGSIMGGSGAPVRVEQSASHGTLPQPEKTEAVTGSAPKATEVTIPTVHDIDVSLHSQVVLSDPIKAPYIGENGNWYEYDAETGTFIDTGTPASGTPPITPDTVGKYLTNNGSKAEWGEVNGTLRVNLNKNSNGDWIIDKTFGEIQKAINDGQVVYVVDTFNKPTYSGAPGYKMFYYDSCINPLGTIFVYRFVSTVNDHIQTLEIYASGGVFVSDVGVNAVLGKKVSRNDLLKLGGDGLNAATPNVDYALPILYVTITQDGEDSDGNPIYKSDKTYEEIKAAHEAGREVKIARAGMFDIEIFLTLGLVDIPLLIIGNEGSPMGEVALFGSSGIPFPELKKATATGGQPIAIFQIEIQKSGEVVVTLPYYVSGGTVVWEGPCINKLPQQYIVRVDKTTDGGLRSDNSYEEISNLFNTYYADDLIPEGWLAISVMTEKEGSIRDIYRFACFTPDSFVFTNVTSDGLSVITLSQKDGKDVWTHEVVPLGIPPVPVTAADNGKFLRVVDGQWAAEAVANAKGVSF